MRFRLHLLFCFFFVSGVMNAQTKYLYTHYMFTNMAINPAYAGSSGGICATGLVRSQWMGFKDAEDNKIAPQTFLLTVDAPIKVLHGAVGGSVMQDKYGFFKNIGVKVGYAYRTDMGAGTFSAGLNVGFQNASYDFSKFIPGEEGDPLIGQSSGKTSDMIIDCDAGLFYQVPDKYYVGLSANNLLQMKGKKVYYQTRRTYYLTGGYQWVIPGSPLFEIDPTALIMYDGATFQFNASALVVYNKKFYGGLGYRLQDAISVLVGVNIKSLRIGVSYDIGTSALKYNNGGLEVMVSYCFKIETDKFRKSYRNTRFL